MTNKILDKNNNYIFNIEEHQYLTFILSGEVFGINILSVKEIIGFSHITRVPSTKSFIEGVTNVRGNVVPVLNLAKRFNLDTHDNTTKTSIIVLSVEIDSELIDIGIIVDRVNQVYDIMEDFMEETPSFGTKIEKIFIKSIGKVDSKFISILDTKSIFNIDELSEVISYQGSM